MDEKQLAEGNLGAVGQYDIDFKEGKLCAELKASHGAVEGSMVVKLDAGAVLDAVAKAIPGQVDDAVFGLIKAALLGK